MRNFISQYAKDNRVESIIHITNMIVRAGMQIKSDKKSDTDYFVMSGNTVEAIINAYQNKNAKSALVIDDLGLQVINRLKQEGVTDITLCLTRIPEKMFALTKVRIKKTFKDFNINIISLEKLTYMKVDLVIANPPYGKNGANITKKILDTVDFTEYVNLEPAVDFITNYNDSINHIEKIIKVPGFGQDAHVLPSIFVYTKNKNNEDSLDDYLIRVVDVDLLKNYFKKNLSRAATFSLSEDTTDLTKTFDTRLIFGVKISADAKNHSNGCNIGGTTASSPYKFNHEQLSLADYYANKKSKGFWGVFIEFTSVLEKQNALKFIYSKDGFRFCNMLTTAMHRDNFHCKEHAMWLPKVDWTRSWTVEEILADYGYTEDEIKEVMDDLKNYKGMED